MFLLKNSTKNIIRNRGRYIPIAILLAIAFSACIVSLLIGNSCRDYINEVKKDFGGKIQIIYDFNALIQANPTKEITADIPISKEDYMRYGDSDYVEKMLMTYTEYALFKEITPIQTSQRRGLIEICGYENVMFLSQNPKFELLSGRMYEGENEVVISNTLSQSSGLKLGDILTVDDESFKGNTKTLTIVGVYDLEKAADKSDNTDILTDNPNVIYTSLDTAYLLIYETDDIRVRTLDRYNVVYYLKSADDNVAFATQVTDKGLTFGLKASFDELLYWRIVEPLDSLAITSNIFVAITFLIALIIIIVMSVLTLRERKYEIGVLRSMGMSKGKLIYGLTTETAVIIIGTVVVGLLVGGLIISPVLLPTFSNISQNLSATLNITLAIQLITGALFLSVLSSLLTVKNIMRLSPMEILINRN